MDKTEFLAQYDMHNGYKAVVFYAEDPQNPRKWDNLGHMACMHKRYKFGDEQMNGDDYTDWQDCEKTLRKENDIAIILPLCLYDHSGINISVGTGGGWDCGQLGFIYVAKDKLRSEYSCKRITKAVLAKAEAVLMSEVQTYDDYIKGEVYAVGVIDEDDNIVDSCGGYYLDHSKTRQENLNGFLEEAKTLSPVPEQLELFAS